jgi:alanine racemase
MSSNARRVARLEIDYAALQHNFHRVKHFAPTSKIMAVVKANGYGHDMLATARELPEADAFAVAMVGEGVALRMAGIEQPLIVLHGFADAEELALCGSYGLSPVVHRIEQIDWLENFSGEALEVWLKIETGMHRLGIAPVDVNPACQRLESVRAVSRMRLMSHFANADMPDNILNNKQIEKFIKVKNNLEIEASMANSAALISFPQSQFEWVRPGIMLYGSSPFADRAASTLGLKAVMRFTSKVIAVKQLRAGDSVGYGSTWVCEKDTRVGYIAAGYGDGYPRHARAGTPVLINGQRCSLAGRVSMDSISVDIGTLEVTPGDTAELWGATLSVDEVARSADSIGYELLCQAGAATGMGD